MINPNKLCQLEKGQRRRKLALCFGALERDILGIAEAGNEYTFKNISRKDYTKKLVQILLTDPSLPREEAEILKKSLMEQDFDEYRTCNFARHALLKIIGTFPAEWDLIIAPHPQSEALAKEKSIGNLGDFATKRDFYSGLYVYAEDIRSPFNLGSIFRTAEALGAEKIFISPNCVSPDHPRCIRSGMGCVETISYERCSLDELPHDLPIFLLETGGTSLKDFEFPKKGIVIIGSEELGVSPEAVKKAKYGCVTIPMKGIKASLNVGVAFGILMQAWVSSLQY